MTDADQEREEVLKRMLKTPHKPHKTLPDKGRDNGNGYSDNGGGKR